MVPLTNVLLFALSLSLSLSLSLYREVMVRRESRDPLELLVSRFVFTPIQQILVFSVSENIAYHIVLSPAVVSVATAA